MYWHQFPTLFFYFFIIFLMNLFQGNSFLFLFPFFFFFFNSPINRGGGGGHGPLCPPSYASVENILFGEEISGPTPAKLLTYAYASTARDFCVIKI